MYSLLKWSLFRGYVSFRECRVWSVHCHPTSLFSFRLKLKLTSTGVCKRGILAVRSMVLDRLEDDVRVLSDEIWKGWNGFQSDERFLGRRVIGAFLLGLKIVELYSTRICENIRWRILPRNLQQDLLFTDPQTWVSNNSSNLLRQGSVGIRSQQQFLMEYWSQDCHLSHEKRAPGWLGFIGDYTIQLYGDFLKLL